MATESSVGKATSTPSGNKRGESPFFVNKIKATAALHDSIPPFSKMSSRYDLEARISTLKMQLSAAMAELDKLEQLQGLKKLEESEMEAMALAFETRPHYKSNWKKAIKGDLVKNVTNILVECYDYFSDPDSGLDPAAVKAQTGNLGSRQWQLFVLKVIHYLKQQGSFNRDERLWNFDTFEDTAGGEDEVTQNAAIYLIEHPEWKPSV